ncbi:5-methyltetrahydropteroyltriglutamate--homocysteine S-methyltransferase [Microbacterium mangrovi]|uniref:5-methyltetrahydropteroyltriglutamate-- homocysteine S-methyltransferase n=1 Tax=Microbacterium mangrovi TaxID=1348253 RepID=UPI000AF72EFF|nr:5-methyltetrahydropteroyltriglutamate--homocysteine S-methyltransferase [Microbacterium mangrovi]
MTVSVHPSVPFPSATILGFPRIGPDRELKKAVEAFWGGTLTESELESRSRELRAQTRARLVELGLGRDDASIPESFSFYDQVLDAAATFGAVPSRFADVDAATLGGYFTLARGRAADAPLEMTKWFNTNYHNLVPELGPETSFTLASRRIVEQFAEAVRDGYLTRPVIVGPVTFLLLSKAAADAPDGFAPLDLLDILLPAYVELLAELKAAGASWVQLDEPGLVSENLGVEEQTVLDATRRAYAVLGGADERPSILVTSPYGSLGEALPVLLDAPVEAVHVDLLSEAPDSIPATEKTLVAGVVGGRNIWRTDLAAALDTLQALTAVAARVSVATSTSLQHLPYSLAREEKLDPQLRSWLAFADEKVGEVGVLADGLANGRAAVQDELDAASAARRDRATAPGVADGEVRARAAALVAADAARTPYATRLAAQQEALDLPALPTTTIGSFPQTGGIRSARAGFARGRITEAEYVRAMQDEIRDVIALQEEIGLDVLVHGEPERNDMVQYFAENLDGFAVTEHGWVQSYGSRCTRPSILWGDVARPAAITVPWSQFAQSLTDKPVKGMLTGPVTILAWSFVRDDQPLGDTAVQVALAIRDEIADLEAAGIGIVQVDEPALRELLPLKRTEHDAYLEWSVGSFRLATAGAADATQVHTHLCYSEFGEVIGAIDALDADVTSIEAARSAMDVVTDIRSVRFGRGIGPGVYDIHSPRVPSTDEVVGLIESALDGIPARQLWINPDCGLKTRGVTEVTESLTAMLAATRQAREALATV